MRNIPKMIAEYFVKWIDEVTIHTVSLGNLFDSYAGQEINDLFESVLKYYDYLEYDGFEIFEGGVHSAWLIRTVFGLPTTRYRIYGISRSAMRVNLIHIALKQLFSDDNEPLIDSVLYAIKNVELTLRPFSDGEDIAKSICESRVSDMASLLSFEEYVQRLCAHISDYEYLCALPLYDQLLATYINDISRHLLLMKEAHIDSELSEKMNPGVGSDITRRCEQNETDGCRATGSPCCCEEGDNCSCGDADIKDVES